MKSGKLDEELIRMNWIVNHITPHSLLLFNESFAATNEREGSEIARQITSVLAKKGIKSLFVTHLYKFASGVFDEHMENVLFLRAERREDGGRTFRIIPREPLQTSFGIDLYNEVFAERFSLDPSRTRISLPVGNGVWPPVEGEPHVRFTSS